MLKIRLTAPHFVYSSKFCESCGHSKKDTIEDPVLPQSSLITSTNTFCMKYNNIYIMKHTLLSNILTTITLVATHTVFTTLLVNNVSQGDGTCVRMPHDPGTATNPVNDLTSYEMACGKYRHSKSIYLANISRL